MKIQKSIQEFERACRVFPGGVNSPVRAFRAVGGQPLIVDRGEGAYLFDVDGNRYIDYVLSWGPLLLGHADPEVVAAIQAAASRGSSYGAPCQGELELALLIQDFFPSMEMLRFVNSGTEATMSALRLSRAYTGRDKIVKFQGCYHGHADLLLVQAGSGVATLGLPDSPGVPRGTVQDTLVASFNNLSEVEDFFARFPDQIAAVIVEPVAGNMGVVLPQPDFLPGLRRITAQAGALLIFDEVMTGFRVHPGGAQALYQVRPDLTTLGKVIGGGLPVGAYGGKAEIMRLVAPEGPVYQAGTLSGNPLAMAAGIATLKKLKEEDGLFSNMQEKTLRLSQEILSLAEDADIPLQAHPAGTMFSVFFAEEPVVDWKTAKISRTSFFREYFRIMLEQGIYLAPSQFEAGFLSAAHGDREIEQTLVAVEAAFRKIQEK